VTFEKQMMSKDKYLIKFIFAPNGGYFVYYPSNVFAQHAGFENWGMSLGHYPGLAGVYSVSCHV